MPKCGQIWQVSLYNFRQWKKNSRIVITFTLGMLMCLLLCDNAALFARQYGTNLQVMETFVWTFGNSSSIMLCSLLLIPLFADMPFIGTITPYYLARTKRSVWLFGQVAYVVVATVLFVAFILLVAVLTSAPISFPGNMWSETGALLGYSGVGEKIALPASIRAMEASLPYICAIQVFLLMTLYAVFTATLMLALNLWKGQLVGILGVLAINLYGLLLSPDFLYRFLGLNERTYYRAHVLLGWLSPLNHATYSMHSFGYDNLPRMWMSCLMFIAATMALLALSFRKISTYNFSHVN